ncbi:DNA polymerase III subunit beta [Candidatus Gottesmanbacteria bacterium]|nr:DNA polymerase III subunit beta [Candidatus Gottesmanbacteria bacterium]
MIAQVLQENLTKALNQVGRLIPLRPQLPILQNLLLTTEEGRLKIIATNLETTEILWVGAKIEKEGELCIPAKLFTELVASLPQEAVFLTENRESLVVKSQGVTATIPGVSAKEFPPIPKSKEKTRSTIKKDEFCVLVGRVSFAAATDEGRPLLTGIRIKKDDGGVVFAATDGYRLSVARSTMSVGFSVDLVVPSRALNEVVKASAEDKNLKELMLAQTEDGQLVFGVGDTEIHTRLIDGEYPNFEKIIPRSFSTRALLDKERLLRAVKSAAVFARDNANIVRFSLNNQTLLVSANTPQVGENKIEVEAKIDGDGGEIAFNSRFLLDFLNNFPDDEVLFEMTGSLNPGVFKPVKDKSYLHVIMPVRVQA